MRISSFAVVAACMLLGSARGLALHRSTLSSRAGVRRRVAAILRMSTSEGESAAAGGEVAAAGLAAVRSRLAEVVGELELADAPRLVAVSKTKPVEMLQACYDVGQRDFGENYAQELMEKAATLPADIAWRFIGHLQSNKAKPLVKAVPGLVCVETVDSQKLANKLNGAAEEMAAERSGPLGVMVQVNTSGEDSKSGLAPGAAVVDLARHVVAECPALKLDGLMTIGAPGDFSAFDVLKGCRDEVARELGLEAGELELSMGMSSDWEEAVAHGSNSIRVGSSIFGARVYK